MLFSGHNCPFGLAFISPKAGVPYPAHFSVLGRQCIAWFCIFAVLPPFFVIQLYIRIVILFQSKGVFFPFIKFSFHFFQNDFIFKNRQKIQVCYLNKGGFSVSFFYKAKKKFVKTKFFCRFFLVFNICKFHQYIRNRFMREYLKRSY